MTASSRIRILALYPDLLNIYADRGNLLFLERRAAWRGIEVTSSGCSTGEGFDPEEVDLLYVGGGQDRDQEAIAGDLLEVKGDSVRHYVEAGRALLAVCGGYQMFGRSWSLGGAEHEGLGVFDCRTVRETGPRLIGPVAIEATLSGTKQVIAGFENHAGRTHLGPEARPFGRVLAGFGNNGSDRTEGAISGNAVGTYMHGPLLPKNPALADWLIAAALEPAAPDPDRLAPLDDELELAAHEVALSVALRRR